MSYGTLPNWPLGLFGGSPGIFGKDTHKRIEDAHWTQPLTSQLPYNLIQLQTLLMYLLITERFWEWEGLMCPLCSRDSRME